MLLTRELQLGGWEASERVEIVRSLHGDMLSFAYASVAVAVGASMTAIQTGQNALWSVVAFTSLIAAIRLVTMLMVRQRSHNADFDVVFWERLYLVLGTVHVASVGAWTTIVFLVGGGAFAQVVSFATAIGYLIGIQARNFPSPLIARVQTAAAAVPMVAGLLIQGTAWYVGYAFILLVFFAGILRTNGRICETFLGALRAARMNEELAHFDTLTHLPNRAYTNRRLDELTRDTYEPFAVHFVDLDRFKRINDTLGHKAGDAVLIETARRFREVVGTSGFISRFAGDEFLILQYGADAEAAAGLADRLVEAMREPFMIQGAPAATGCSIGTALFPLHGEDAELLTRQADTALYQAKSAGRSTARMFAADMLDRETNRLRIETGLRLALEDNQLRLFFQPLVEPNTLRISTCEALIRWMAPDGRMISPGEFLPVAEETGLMGMLTDWTLYEAMRIASDWPSSVAVAVNLSPSQLLRADMVEVISTALRETNFDPRRLEIEITENLLLGEHQPVLAKLEALRDMGISIALDDFGTGFSNFSYIARLPIGKVKIDRSFLTGIIADKRRQSLLRGFVHLVASLDLRIVVEGVETIELLEFVSSDPQVTQIQGFVFGRPLPETAIGTLLRASSSAGREMAENRPRIAIAGQ